MRRIALAMLAGFGGLGLAAAPARAASFDCSRVRAPDEVAICGNRVLSELDTEMAALWYAFSRVPMLMGSNGARHDEAQAFLQQRAHCGGNIACLRAVYVARNAVLRREIAQAMQSLSHYVTG
jgi:uncharacterized protein